MEAVSLVCILAKKLTSVRMCPLLGRTEGKKCSPIDSGILGAYADMYRRLLVKQNQGAYFIKFWPHRPSCFIA